MPGGTTPPAGVGLFAEAQRWAGLAAGTVFMFTPKTRPRPAHNSLLDFFLALWSNTRRYYKYLKAVTRPVSRVFLVSLQPDWPGVG
jgi:hypothetical protein